MADTNTTTASTEKAKSEASAPAGDDSKAADSAASTGSESPSDPSVGYSRGERQKPISRAYKNNWDNIFGKKKRSRR